MTGPLSAILLAGGRARRMGGTPKTLLTVGGDRLIDLAVGAARDVGADPVVVVGPTVTGVDAVMWAREDPPFGGPAAATVAGLAAMRAAEGGAAETSAWTLLVACDLPGIRGAVTRLVADAALLPRDTDGLCLADASSRPQWLTGIYRTSALGRAARIARASRDHARGLSVRSLLDDLAIAVVEAPVAETADVDTWDDLTDARRRAGAPNDAPQSPTTDDRTDQHTGADMSASSRALPPEALDEWAAALRQRFDLGAEDLPIALILDLARDVAVGVARPAAPVSAFAAGLIAGRAGGSADEVRDAVQIITALAEDWGAET